MLNINKFKCYALSHNWKIVFMLTLAMRSEVITNNYFIYFQEIL